MYINRKRLAVCIALWLYGILGAREYSTIFLTLPSFILMTLALVSRKENYFTSHDMLWLCMIVYFVVGPCQSIKDNEFALDIVDTFTSRGFIYQDIDFVFAEIILCLAIISFMLGQIIGSKQIRLKIEVRNRTFEDIFRKRNTIIYLVFVSFVFNVILTGGIENTLASRDEKTNDYSLFSVVFLAIQTVGTVYLSVILPYAKTGWRSFFLKMLYGLILICLFITVNPFNSPRFVILSIWLPVIFALTHDRISLATYYSVLVGGILLILPLLRATSTGGFSVLTSGNLDQFFQDATKLKFVDIFDTLVHAVHYMTDHQFFLGSNVVAIVLFFVPRAIWPSKPTVGGLIIGDDLYSLKVHGTSNLSFFLAGDFYMDFGFLGVIVGCFITGILFTRYLRNEVVISDRRIRDLILLGSIPILLRGPVGAILGYFTCLFAASFLLLWLTKPKSSNAQVFSGT